jgi:hypothetical protein
MSMAPRQFVFCANHSGAMTCKDSAKAFANCCKIWSFRSVLYRYGSSPSSHDFRAEPRTTMKEYLLPSLGLLVVCLFGCSKEPEGPAQPLNLVEGAANDDVVYTAKGQGTSTNMELHIHNKSQQHWELEIKVGYKLELADGDIQTMVVTEEVEVEVHPHDDVDVLLPVACLDISKDPPGQMNTDWALKDSQSLADFIAAAKSKIDDLAKTEPDQADQRLRNSLLQALLCIHSTCRICGPVRRVTPSSRTVCLVTTQNRPKHIPEGLAATVGRLEKWDAVSVMIQTAPWFSWHECQVRSALRKSQYACASHRHSQWIR